MRHAGRPSSLEFIFIVLRNFQLLQLYQYMNIDARIETAFRSEDFNYGNAPLVSDNQRNRVDEKDFLEVILGEEYNGLQIVFKVFSIAKDFDFKVLSSIAKFSPFHGRSSTASCAGLECLLFT